ncbi:LysR family transcriptional regulator [Ferrimonas aestuarii]|uniref:LysR family transcriptional regulator n=1 Tax=Ferrimonas aestuarii TaxID=2569539 RepID=A0A4U1BG50_9GAMM|nr:LysR family transcriptional regulator [Ferrimonas aestuarii]TKB50126.1 LysR family transcriptional regulator [Ferrimonas aestuarii]
MNKLRQMQLFMTIVEAGSITKAADRAELSKSVLSHHLKQLERQLEVTLLKRTTRRQSLTVAGERFYQHCRKMNQVAEQAWDEVRADQRIPSGKLTLTAPHALMNAVVTPALVKAFADFPQLSLNLVCEDTQLDLMASGIDVAIRVGQSPDSNYRQKRIGGFREWLCQPSGADIELASAPYIANHWQGAHIEHEYRDDGGKCQTQHFTAAHRTNTVHQTLSLIELGLGIGLIPDLLMASHQGVEPVSPAIGNSLSVYALHPYHSAVPKSVSMAIEAIEQALKTPVAAPVGC